MRHLIDPLDLTQQEITQLLDLADRICADPAAYQEVANHKKLATLFYEPSTRTRLSFEAAMLNLGGHVLGFPSENVSSATKGESVADTIRVVSCYADIVAMRHPKEGAPLRASRYSRIPVINAGDGMNEHPTQALLDMLTMREHLGGLEGAKVAICGDVMHSRVARSNIYGLTTMGAKVVLCAPPTLIPPRMDEMGCTIAPTIEDACENADVVMGLRIQRERQQKGLFPSVAEYCDHWEITPQRLALAKKNALVMHPGPMNRGVEIASSVADCGQSVITQQVESGVAVRMALLYMLTRRENV